MSYQKHVEKFAGKKTKEILIFSLSSCFWCDKVEEFLKERGVEFSVLTIDKLEGAIQQEAVAEMSKYNSGMSFPTIVINAGEKVIIGFNKEELTKEIS